MYDDEHLRRFLAARARGDSREMRRWWNELVIDFFDRIDGLVGAAHRGRLDDDEHDEAVQLSMIKFSKNLIETFAGDSMGELVNATRTLARGICIDVQRKSIRVRDVESNSFDAGWDDDKEDAPSRSWETGEAWERAEREERRQDTIEFLNWALPQVAESRREVLKLTFEGAEVDEITGVLGLSRDNAYQLRSRGMSDLKKLKERYDE